RQGQAVVDLVATTPFEALAHHFGGVGLTGDKHFLYSALSEQTASLVSPGVPVRGKGWRCIRGCDPEAGLGEGLDSPGQLLDAPREADQQRLAQADAPATPPGEVEPHQPPDGEQGGCTERCPREGAVPGTEGPEGRRGGSSRNHEATPVPLQTLRFDSRPSSIEARQPGRSRKGDSGQQA